jgi:hypothetical protein
MRTMSMATLVMPIRPPAVAAVAAVTVMEVRGIPAFDRPVDPAPAKATVKVRVSGSIPW